MSKKRDPILSNLVIRLREGWIMEKRVDSAQLSIIHKRNKLMFIVFVVLSILDLTTNIFIYPVVLPAVLVMAILCCGVAYLFVLRPNLAELGMYVIIAVSFLPFWVVAYVDKDVINFFFLIMPLIMSSVYNRILPILMASVLTCITFAYFYFDYFELVFYEHLKKDVVYFLLLTLCVTVYLIFSSRLTEGILINAEKKEKETSRELVTTKEFLEAYYNNTTDAIGVYDLNGNVLQINSSFEKMFKVKANEIIGSVTSFLSFTIKESSDKYLTKMIEQKRFSFETETYTSDLEIIDVNVTVTPVKNQAGEIVALVYLIKDISDKKRTEEALLQSEKLSVIGELAAGVAHEIRNPVTVLKGFVQLLSQKPGLSERFYYEIMQQELERINQITNEFMALAKPQAIKIKNHNFIELIQQVTAFLESEALLHRVEIMINKQAKSIWLDCEPNQMKQVLINTVKNSIEAMPEGGKITIQVKTLDGFVHVLLKDEGKGIPADIIEKLGQPFFTTKENGTGLGLMVSMKIIENHGGIFSIQSEENKGTTIKILLPIHQNKSSIL